MEQKPLAELLLTEKGNWVVGYLDAIPQTPDEIAKRARLHVYAVVEGLVNLELRGEAKNVGDYRYIKAYPAPPTNFKHGCMPSTKHPGRCAECGEPMDTREEE